MTQTRGGDALTLGDLDQPVAAGGGGRRHGQQVGTRLALRIMHGQGRDDLHGRSGVHHAHPLVPLGNLVRDPPGLDRPRQKNGTGRAARLVRDEGTECGTLGGAGGDRVQDEGSGPGQQVGQPVPVDDRDDRASGGQADPWSDRRWPGRGSGRSARCAVAPPRGRPRGPLRCRRHAHGRARARDRRPPGPTPRSGRAPPAGRTPRPISCRAAAGPPPTSVSSRYITSCLGEPARHLVIGWLRGGLDRPPDGFRQAVRRRPRPRGRGPRPAPAGRVLRRRPGRADRAAGSASRPGRRPPAAATARVSSTQVGAGPSGRGSGGGHRIGHGQDGALDRPGQCAAGRCRGCREGCSDSGGIPGLGRTRRTSRRIAGSTVPASRLVGRVGQPAEQLGQDRARVAAGSEQARPWPAPPRRRQATRPGRSAAPAEPLRPRSSSGPGWSPCPSRGPDRR